MQGLGPIPTISPLKKTEHNHASSGPGGGAGFFSAPSGSAPPTTLPKEKTPNTLRLFDLDGTLTRLQTGYPTDLWHEVTTHFMSEENRKKFAEIQQEWKQYMKAAEDPAHPHNGLPTQYFNPEHLHSTEHPRAAYSAEMMQHGLNLMSEAVTEEAVRGFVEALTLRYVKEEVVLHDGIEYLSKSVSKGDACVISTGGYETGAHGFLDGLVTAGLLAPDIRAKIQVSGSEMDWAKKQVIRANVEENKIAGLKNRLGLTSARITDQLASIHIDSPEGGDKGLVILAEAAKHRVKIHIIETKKNQAFHPHCQTWKERSHEDMPSLVFRPICSEPIPIAGRKSKARGTWFFESTWEFEREMRIQEERGALLQRGRPRSNSTPSPSGSPMPSL